MANKRRTKQRYSVADKIRYYYIRKTYPARHGYAEGSTKQFYGNGFINAFDGANLTKDIRKEVGKRQAAAYRSGLLHGRKAVKQYMKNGGKDPKQFKSKVIDDMFK